MSCIHERNHVEQAAMLQQDLVYQFLHNGSRNHYGRLHVGEFLASVIVGMRGGGWVLGGNGRELQGRSGGEDGGVGEEEGGGGIQRAYRR
ncbi:hypothetical protein O181_116370 [Austropuccinia psidii MF-1]|uniref:Uncharacterized protein n=1 Tax=Austropuccinia psidii MF-1 TaxID=1389203 RepID=A0A9Q3KC97_9BASI|nr:hypothetical protein [Austropuccinia psidii MF-1]